MYKAKLHYRKQFDHGHYDAMVQIVVDGLTELEACTNATAWFKKREQALFNTPTPSPSRGKMIPPQECRTIKLTAIKLSGPYSAFEIPRRL